MLVSLYTSRVILNTLGVEDYGIYNVVGGVVIMLGFINSAMSASTQRYMSFELGKNDFKQLNKVFSTSINIHLLVAIFVIIVAESIGLWFLNTQMNIVSVRMTAANWVYQFSIITFVVNIITIPYQASVISHEAMNIFSLMSILETFLKLIIVFVLIWIEADKLILFSLLSTIVIVFVRILYVLYCKKKYNETHYEKIWDIDLMKEMGGFANWNLLGAFAGVTYNQGVNIIMNIFFGVTVNAARAVSFQVQNAINSFVTNFQLAVNPVITKSYAVNNRNYMYLLIFRGTKLSFYMLLCISIPFFVETNFILTIWLKNVPNYAVIFTQLVLIDTLIGSISGFIQTMVQSSGRVKLYQIVVSGILLFNLPVSYLLLYKGFPPQYTFYVSISLSIAALFARLIIVYYNENFPIKSFINKVILPIISVLLLVIIILYFFKMRKVSPLLNMILSELFVITIILIFGIDKKEREFLKQKIRKQT